jgi:hypothetical protein
MPRGSKNMTGFLRDEFRRLICVSQYEAILKSGDDMKVAEIEKKLKDGFHGIGKGECFAYLKIYNLYSTNELTQIPSF